MLKTRDIPDIEILAVGKWPGTGCPVGGCAFTEDDLDEIVAAYEATKDVLTIPLKLGHDNNQAMLQTDGHPAAGWLSNVRRDGGKLIADLLKVPEKIAQLMDAGAWRNRSVELDEIEHAGKKWGAALTGMALLGADIPAVRGLADIAALYTREKLDLAANARAVVFSAEDTPEQETVRVLMTYADNAEHVLADVTAFIARTGELVTLRAEKGRKLSEKHTERLAALRDGLQKVQASLDVMLAEEPAPDDPPEPDYGPVMHLRARLADLRMTEVAGVTT